MARRIGLPLASIAVCTACEQAVSKLNPKLNARAPIISPRLKSSYGAEIHDIIHGGFPLSVSLLQEFGGTSNGAGERRSIAHSVGPGDELHRCNGEAHGG